jgi:hypothetical protein
VALVTNAEVIAWVEGGGAAPISGYDASTLTASIAAAGEIIVGQTSRIWEKTGVVEYFDGDAALGKYGEQIKLRRFPVIYPVSNPDVFTVSENGVSVALLAGYTTLSGALVKDANLDRPCSLLRVGTGPSGRLSWARGVQNIQVSYTAGYATLPESIKAVAKELAWLIYQQGRKTGLDSLSESGASRKLISALSWGAQLTINQAQVY